MILNNVFLWYLTLAGRHIITSPSTIRLSLNIDVVQRDLWHFQSFTLVNPFPLSDAFGGIWVRQKHCVKKEKLLVMSNFSVCHNVFNSETQIRRISSSACVFQRWLLPMLKYVGKGKVGCSCIQANNSLVNNRLYEICPYCLTVIQGKGHSSKSCLLQYFSQF